MSIVLALLFLLLIWTFVFVNKGCSRKSHWNCKVFIGEQCESEFGDRRWFHTTCCGTTTRPREGRGNSIGKRFEGQNPFASIAYCGEEERRQGCKSPIAEWQLRRTVIWGNLLPSLSRFLFYLALPSHESVSRTHTSLSRQFWDSFLIKIQINKQDSLVNCTTKVCFRNKSNFFLVVRVLLVSLQMSFDFE